MDTIFSVSALIEPATLCHVAKRERFGKVTARRQYGMAVERALPLFLADVDEYVANGYSRADATDMVLNDPEWYMFPVMEFKGEPLYLQNKDKSAFEIEAPDEVICAARCAACLVHNSDSDSLVWSALIKRGFKDLVTGP